MSRKKVFKYDISDLTSEYNEDLYNEVSNKIEIRLLKNKHTGWAAKIENDKAIILYDKSDYADACFAHELLHIKYELNGLKMPFFKDKENVSSLFPFLFNQLCHHKFFHEFYEMGFHEEEFLNETDISENYGAIRRDIKLLESIYNENGVITGSPALLLPYMYLKSPHDLTDETKGLVTKLKQLGDKDFFTSIDNILSDWIEEKSLDVSLIFARIFKACNRPQVGFCLSGNEKDIIIAGNIK